MTIKNEAKLRKQYEQRVSALLLGPGSEMITTDVEHEIITERPQSRYVTGILYHPEKDDTQSEDFSGVDNEFKPKSLGLTFYVLNKNIPNLKAHLETARYEKIDQCTLKLSSTTVEQLSSILKEFPNFSENYKILDSNTVTFMSFGTKSPLLDNYKSVKDKIGSGKGDGWNLIEKLAYQKGPLFQRKLEKFDFVVDLSQIGKVSSKDFVLSNNKKVKVFSKIQALKYDNEDSDQKALAITLVLKNDSEDYLFQSVFSVVNQAGIDFIASEDVSQQHIGNLSDEDATNVMLYRNKKSYAIGRGVSAVWESNNDGVSLIKTSYIPTYEITPMQFEIQGLPEEVLSPSTYISAHKEDALSKLTSFVKVYEDWIDGLDDRLMTLSEAFQQYAKDNIQKCRQSAHRMRKALKMLLDDDAAFKSFQIANEAILLQRMSGNSDKIQAYQDKNYSSVNFKWRPFQLAYILNSFESTLNDQSSDRDVLDLIWISTGGGKTEAYLFSIAAVIAYRRQKYVNSSGVTAIMRYTLRLLTSQQFERASKLICSMEYIRRKRKDELGEEPITIGLWIGDGTENRRKRARENFRKKMLNASSLEQAKRNNIFPVLKCPWCEENESLIPTKENFKSPIRWGYKPITNKNSSLEMACTNLDCPFSLKPGGLPIYVVDDDIYNVRPSLLFGTVDKFAQVPLKEETQRLFGSDDVANIRRPELIIQDELHLISGPLGSLVGLFESGFDYVFQHGGTIQKPKYIASTATIRNAKEQVRSIFDRKVQQFPPNGLETEDNFFVKEDFGKNGRKYFGVMGTGKSQLTMEVRLIAALLQVTKDMNLPVDEEELFWTITGYFNSLRELGKASNLIASDVDDQLKILQKRNQLKKRNISSQSLTELTSRVPGSEIPKKIAELEVAHSAEKDESKDVLIATNMLSVGIDISRLNTMFVVGQPKLTSEYIQATSRVGRQHLGSVWTLYNSTRSRDRSHYETFQTYHQNLYKYVEATSVTPFSAPALRKAGASVVVTMLRNTIKELAGQDNARNITEYQDVLDKVKNYLIARIMDLPDKDLYANKANEIIQNDNQKWIDLAEEATINGDSLNYYVNRLAKKNTEKNTLLRGFDDTRDGSQKAIPTMETMRTVEDSAFLRLIEDDDSDCE